MHKVLSRHLAHLVLSRKAAEFDQRHLLYPSPPPPSPKTLSIPDEVNIIAPFLGISKLDTGSTAPPDIPPSESFFF